MAENSDKKLKTKLNDEENDISKEIESIIDSEDISTEEKHTIKKMVGMSMQMGGVISPQLELMKKMTPDHITEFLEGQREATRCQFKESRDSKIFCGFILLVALSFIIVLIVLLRDIPETMEKVIYAAGGFAAGIVGGYGFGKTRSDE